MKAFRRIWFPALLLLLIVVVPLSVMLKPCGLWPVRGGALSIDWWAGAVSALLGAVFGSCIPLWWSWRLRRIERRGDIDAMQVELHQGHLYMHALCNDGIKAPLYRLPVSLFKQALPRILGEQLLEIGAASALVEYTNRTEELNRGLDRAGDAHAALAIHDHADEKWLNAEYSRNVMKATDILKTPMERYGGQTLADAAQAAVFSLEGRFGEAALKSAPPQPPLPPSGANG